MEKDGGLSAGESCWRCGYPSINRVIFGSEMYSRECPACGSRKYGRSKTWEKDGFGVIRIYKKGKKKPLLNLTFHGPVYKEELEKIWDSYVGSSWDMEKSYLTWWDEVNEKLLVLKGCLPVPER